MKRYVRPKKKLAKSKKKSLQKHVTCWVCFKKIERRKAVYIGGNRSMCIEHDSAYQISPLAYVMSKRIMEA